jgi:hypothetical protein
MLNVFCCDCDIIFSCTAPISPFLHTQIDSLNYSSESESGHIVTDPCQI